MEEASSPVAPMTILEVAIPRCAADVMIDEVVALNVETGIYYSIRELAVATWNDLAAGYPVEQLCSCIHAVTGSDKTLLDFVSEVCRHGLMRPSAAARAAEGEPLFSTALREGRREFVLEVFEDMMDLILSDPIHDVDEAKGWPSPATVSR